MSLDNYRELIAKATDKAELHAISYRAFLEDERALCMNSLSSKVDKLCIKRERELGLV